MQPIAIIGTGCLLPNANDPEQFWQNLSSGVDALSKFNKPIYPNDLSRLLYTKNEKIDKIATLSGGWINSFNFDASGYNVDSKTLEDSILFNQYALHAARQAMQQCGYNNAHNPKRAAIILGSYSWGVSESTINRFSSLYNETLLKGGNDHPLSTQITSRTNTHSLDLSLDLISRALNVIGPAYTIDAACASSLYAFKLASWHLAHDDIDFALAGGVSVASTLFSTFGFSALGALTKERSRPLDANSNSIAPAEGSCIFVLKNLDKALRDGDNIKAVIRGIGLSNDGKGQHLLAPNKKGQLLAYKRAYKETGLSLQDIDYLELHATGTSLGDKTELNALHEFNHNDSSLPFLGAVKSNIGHTLTASGAIGALKCIKAINYSIIPKTIAIENTLGKELNIQHKIVQKSTPWLQKERVKRAAVNSFGFGGANAHMILEEYSSHVDYPTTQAEPLPKLAIVGMDGIFGPWQGIDQLANKLYQGQQAFDVISEQRSSGIGLNKEVWPLASYIDHFEFDALRYRIPPNELNNMHPAQLLMLKTADAAIKRSNLKSGDRVAVIIGMGFDFASHRLYTRWLYKNQLAFNQPINQTDAEILADSIHASVNTEGFLSYIGNLLASRISSLWDFSGPAFTLSAQEDSVMQALKIAQFMLANDQADAVVVGGIELGVDPEVLTENENKLASHTQQTVTLSFDERMQGIVPGDGAGAFIVQTEKNTTPSKVLAYIDACSQEFSYELSAKSIKDNVKESFAEAKITPSNIDFIELNASGIAKEDQAECAGLTEAYCDTNNNKKIVVSSVKSQVGHTFAASGMAALIRTTLCLSQNYLPATPLWQRAKSALSFDSSNFFIAPKAYPWLSQDGKRYAAISILANNKSHSHIIMHDNPSLEKNNVPIATPCDIYLLAIDGNSRDEIINKVEELLILNETKLEDKINFYTKNINETHSSKIKLAIVGNEIAQIISELKSANQKLKQADTLLSEWKTPAGSYYTEIPLGKKTKICLVYPGLYNLRPQLTLDFLQSIGNYFSQDLKNLTAYKREIINKYMYPLCKKSLETQDLQNLQQTLFDSVESLFTIKTVFSLLYTSALKECFKVKASSSLGYSSGECIAVMSNLIWQEESLLKLASSSTHVSPELIKPFSAANKYFNLPKDKDIDWASYYLMVNHIKAQTICKRYTKAFITNINTNEEIVISGDRSTCQEVIKKLKCDSFELPAHLIMHCDIVSQVRNKFYPSYTHACNDKTRMNVYLGSRLHQPPFNSHDICNQLIDDLILPVNFPKLINNAYTDGHKIFIEIGPGTSCTSLIKNILTNNEHLAISMDDGKSSLFENLHKLLAALYSHGVKIQIPKGFSLPININGDSNCQTLMTEIKLGRSSIVKKNIRRLSQKKSITQTPNESEKNSLPINNLLTELKDRNQYYQISLNHQSDLIDKIFNTTVTTRNKYQSQYPSADIMEFTEGSVARVFGSDFSQVDLYPVRLRLPSPPFLSVTRVIHMDAKPLSLQGGSIITEYDIPNDAWYAIDKQVCFMPMDAQGVLFLLSYLGVDIAGQGKWQFRWLDSNIQFCDDFPLVGQTLRYSIHVDSLIRTENSLLATSNYLGSVNGKPVIKIFNTKSGFFSKESLAMGKCIGKASEIVEKHIQNSIKPLLACNKSSFCKQDLSYLQNGNLSACFGISYHSNKSPSLKLSQGPMLMIDRMAHVSNTGGRYGFGYLISEIQLDINNWYLRNHFKDAPVLAGPCMLQASIDTLEFFALYFGLHTLTNDARFQMSNEILKLRFRKQVAAVEGVFSIRVDISSIELTTTPKVLADICFIYDDEIIGTLDNIGITLKEKNISSTKISEVSDYANK